MRALLLAALLLGWASRAGAQESCMDAVAAAEARHGVPAGLLAAMAQVESGRPGAHGVEPWPWTVNAGGRGRFFPDKQSAMDAVKQLQAAGQGFVDVGCLQVNLGHHPAAFATLDDAFDPASNADYAARYLAHLAATAASGDWMLAAGFYNTMTTAKADAYRASVAAALGRRIPVPVAALPPLRASAAPPLQPAGGRAGVLPEDWAAITRVGERHAWKQDGAVPLSAGTALALADALERLARPGMAQR